MTPESQSLLDTMLTELCQLHDKPEEQKAKVAKINEVLAAENVGPDNIISIAINNSLKQD